MNKYEQNLVLTMQMHYQEIKQNFKNYMNNRYKSQGKDSNRLSNLQTIYNIQEKNRAML